MERKLEPALSCGQGGDLPIFQDIGGVERLENHLLATEMNPPDKVGGPMGTLLYLGHQGPIFKGARRIGGKITKFIIGTHIDSSCGGVHLDRADVPGVGNLIGMPRGTVVLQKSVVVGKIHRAVGILVHIPVLGPAPIFRFGIVPDVRQPDSLEDRKSTRLNSSHVKISYAVFCLKKKNNEQAERGAFEVDDSNVQILLEQTQAVCQLVRRALPEVDATQHNALDVVSGQPTDQPTD